AVQQITQERLALEHFDVVGEIEPMVRCDLERPALDLWPGPQRRSRHPEERKEDDDGTARDHQGGDPAPMTLPDFWCDLARRHGRWCNRAHTLLRSSTGPLS